MRGRGGKPARQQGGRRSRSTRRRAEVTGVGAPTGVFSTVGAEPRSSWTVPGDVVIPNPSVDPAARSWVDPDVVPGVLGPPQANPTEHSALPVEQPVGLAGALADAKGRRPAGDPAAESGSDPAGVSAQGSAGDRRALMRNASFAGAGPGTGTGLFHRSGLDGQTGPISLVREPRTQLVGALIAVVVVILLLGRLGDLLSPAPPVGPGMRLGAAPAGLGAPSGQPAPNPQVTRQSLKDDPTAVAVGGQGPQLVAIGIGGDLTAERAQRWGEVGAQTNARFTFFPSITSLLGPIGIDRYRQPGPNQAILPNPVSPSDDEAQGLVSALVSALVAGNDAGHETAASLGPDTCPDGQDGAWTASDWASELGQLRSVAAQPNAYNAWSDELPDLFGGGLNGATSACAPDGVGSNPGAQSVGPGRLAAAAAEADLAWTLDAAAPSGQAAQPRRTIGLWRFSPVPLLEATVDAAGQIRTGTADLDERLEASLSGERAPFIVHLDPRGAQASPDEAAALEFARAACGRSEVRCITFSEAARYLDAYGPTPSG